MSTKQKPVYFDVHGEIRFRKVGPWEFFVDALHRVNATEWRGHAPRTVRLLDQSGERINSKDGSDWRQRFTFIRTEPECLGISSQTMFGAVDFNEFDFGEHVP